MALLLSGNTTYYLFHVLLPSPLNDCAKKYVNLFGTFFGIEALWSSVCRIWKNWDQGIFTLFCIFLFTRADAFPLLEVFGTDLRFFVLLFLGRFGIVGGIWFWCCWGIVGGIWFWCCWGIVNVGGIGCCWDIIGRKKLLLRYREYWWHLRLPLLILAVCCRLCCLLFNYWWATVWWMPMAGRL